MTALYYIMLPDGSVKETNSLREWGEYMESANRTVAKFERGGVIVSTVFLGIDHRYGLTTDKPPILWETMIFGGPEDGNSWRYGSLKDALDGHEKIVKSLFPESSDPTPRE